MSSHIKGFRTNFGRKWLHNEVIAYHMDEPIVTYATSGCFSIDDKPLL